MLRTTLIFSFAILGASHAFADDGVCKPMAALAKMSAEQRDRGVSQDALLRALVREGKLNSKDAAAPFVVNTILWVYEENVPSKSAYQRMFEKCRRAFAKQR